MSAPRRYRLILTAALIAGLLASLYVAVVRVHREHNARRVEIVMDYPDFNALARSYGYNEEQLLIAFRRAGLTSLAVSEELGSSIDSGTSAVLLSGPQLLAQSRLATLSEPTLARLARTGGIRADELYLLVYDPLEVARYVQAIRLHLGPHALRVVRASGPAIIAVKSQIDFFNALGLGLPARTVDLARRLGLLLVPRVQNDERFDAAQIDRIFAGFGPKTSTIVFFGTRNEVLGYPDHIDDAAAALERTGVNFGSIETYDKTQVQKGNDGLAKAAIDRTVRVQAISKAELDKLDFETVVARYLLGARERNVRVVYLRPYLHALDGQSLEATNVTMIERIADGLKARGLTLGRATPLPKFDVNPLFIIIASLAVPAIVLLLFEAFGIRRAPLAYALFAADVLLVVAGYAVHHDLFVRKMLALAGGISFATMGVVAIPRAFTGPTQRTYGQALAAGLRTVGVAYLFALGGALLVIGLLSVPLMMQEIDRFTGVHLLIAVPPVLAFALYVYTRRFGNEPPGPAQSALAPVRVYQLALLVVLAGAAFLYLARSGNQSDIAPSSFELALRSNLTAVLGVRPRFKEFLIGVPLLMLLPALRLEHRRLTGWLFAVAAAIGTADVVDTFSHLHTPVFVSLLRIVNGAVLGAVVGAVLIWAYRAIAFRGEAALSRSRAA
jgi:hypothetical protein